MSSFSIPHIVAGASFLMLLALLFSLYQNPLFELYLSSWGLC